MMSRVVVLVLAALALAMVAGCGEEGVTPDTVRNRIAPKELPGPIMKAAKAAIADCEVVDVFENRDKGKTLQSYEVRGRNKKGKIREVRVSLTGEILERED